ncbi:MAG: hypothetical protein V7655_06535 [Aequorivita antarctica]
MNRKLLKTLTAKTTKDKLTFPQRKAGEKVCLGNEAIVNGDARYYGVVTMPDKSKIKLFAGIVYKIQDKAGKQLKRTMLK